MFRQVHWSNIALPSIEQLHIYRNIPSFLFRLIDCSRFWGCSKHCDINLATIWLIVASQANQQNLLALLASPTDDNMLPPRSSSWEVQRKGCSRSLEKLLMSWWWWWQQLLDGDRWHHRRDDCLLCVCFLKQQLLLWISSSSSRFGFQAAALALDVKQQLALNIVEDCPLNMVVVMQELQIVAADESIVHCMTTSLPQLNMNQFAKEIHSDIRSLGCKLCWYEQLAGRCGQQQRNAWCI